MTFNGSDILGQSGGSAVRVEPGPVERQDVRYGIQGIPGTFIHDMGTRARSILVTGTLKAASASALNGVETTLEDTVAAATEATLADDWGRSFQNCVLAAYDRKGPRRKTEGGVCLQDFEARFTQLSV